MMIDRYLILASSPSGLEATGLGLSTGPCIAASWYSESTDDSS